MLGELDNSGSYVDTTGPHPPAITLMIEIKNTRAWYYTDDEGVLRLLAKAAHLQQSGPDAPIAHSGEFERSFRVSSSGRSG